MDVLHFTIVNLTGQKQAQGSQHIAVEFSERMSLLIIVKDCKSSSTNMELNFEVACNILDEIYTFINH